MRRSWSLILPLIAAAAVSAAQPAEEAEKAQAGVLLRLGSPDSDSKKQPIYGQFVPSLNGKVLACPLDDKLCLVDPANGKILHQANGWFSSPCLSRDGSIVASPEKNKVLFWHPRDKKEVTVTPDGKEENIRAFALAPDGKTAASNLGKDEWHIWDTVNGKSLHTFKHKGTVDRLVFSPDGKLLAAALAGEDDGDIVLHHTDSGREFARFAHKNAAFLNRFWLNYSLSFSPDGAWLAAGGKMAYLNVWNLADKKVVRQESPIRCVDGFAFGGHGRMLVVLGGSRARVFETSSMTVRRVISHDDLGSANGDDVKEWGRLPNKEQDEVMLKKIKELPPHLREVACDYYRKLHGDMKGTAYAPFTSIAMSPDGNRLITGGKDHTALVWDVWAAGPGAGPASWDRLAGNADDAWQAMCQLKRQPNATIKLLDQNLQALRKDEVQIKRLIRQLDDEDFEKRRSSYADLDQLHDLAIPALQGALKDRSLSLEARRAVQRLLALANATNPRILRMLRSIELLEEIGGDNAKVVLDRLAGGAPESQVTREAKQSRQRLGK